MKRKNLLRLGFLSLFCVAGTFAWADDTVTLPNTDVTTCTFSEDGASNETFTIAGSIAAAADDDGNLTYGSVTIGETEYKYYLKLDTNGSISFTATSECTATLVFGPNDDYAGTSSYIYIETDGKKSGKIYVTDQVYTFECAAGSTYKVEKGSGEYHLFYIGLTGGITTPVEEEAIEVSDANYCTFAKSDAIEQTGNITFTLANDNSSSSVTNSSHGTALLSINGTETECSYCLKTNSHATLSFTTTEKMTMTLVFENDNNLSSETHTDRCITIDNSETPTTITEGRVMQVVLEDGDHTLTMGSAEHYLFYVGLTSGDTTGINGVTLQTTGNNIYYNLNGQRVSKPTQGVYILNGKKVLVK